MKERISFRTSQCEAELEVYLFRICFIVNSMYVWGVRRSGYVLVTAATCGGQHLISLEWAITDSCEPSYCMTRARILVPLHYMCLTTEPS